MASASAAVAAAVVGFLFFLFSPLMLLLLLLLLLFLLLFFSFHQYCHHRSLLSLSPFIVENKTQQMYSRLCVPVIDKKHNTCVQDFVFFILS